MRITVKHKETVIEVDRPNFRDFQASTPYNQRAEIVKDSILPLLKEMCQHLTEIRENNID